MIGLGTIINCAGIILGGLIGLLGGKFVKENVQDALTKVCGVCTMLIGIAGAVDTVAQQSLLVIGSLALGTALGELLNLEGLIEKFGTWLKVKTGNAKDSRFVEGFVTASLTVCIGAMAIVGSIQDGISGDYSVLATKAVLDLIIIMVMTCALGKGCIFSALPVALLQGGVTALAGILKPFMTDAALANLSLVGSILILCVGINLLFGKRLRVANMLPAIIFSVAAAFLPI